MIVAVIDPHTNRLPTGLLGLIDAGVEAFLGKQPLVPLDLPVMPRRVRSCALMTRGMRLYSRDIRAEYVTVIWALTEEGNDAVTRGEFQVPTAKVVSAVELYTGAFDPGD